MEIHVFQFDYNHTCYVTYVIMRILVMLLWPLDSCLLKFFLKNYCAVQIGIFIEKTKQNKPSLLYCFDLITRGPLT